MEEMRGSESVRLGRSLGQGAVAEVFEAFAPDGRRFAAKILHASHRDDAAARARFAQEARLLAEIDHDNIVRVVGLAEVSVGDRVQEALLLELVDGPSLRRELAIAAPFDAARTSQLARGIAAGLSAAHEAGVVHRDLKPANVLLAASGPKIADFGMARASSLAGADPGALTVLGTPDYMAPECVDPLAVDARTDLYALGVMMFEMMTGAPPYHGATSLGVLAAHRDQPIPELDASHEAALAGLVRRLLAKAPGERPQAARVVVDELDAILEGHVDSIAAVESVALVRDRYEVSACTRCGRPLVPTLGQCIECGARTLQLDAGPCRVLVVGPGDVGDKFDSRLRELLVELLRASPGLGLTPRASLHKRIPRLPFVLLRGVSERSAESFVVALASLGIEGVVASGSALAVPAMRKKARQLAGRSAAIGAGMWGAFISQPHAIWVSMLVMVGLVAGTVIGAVLPVTGRRSAAFAALPEPVAAALQIADAQLDTLTTARHREALGAVLRRVLAVLPRLASDDVELHEELGQVITCATGAATHLDTLDRQLEAGGLHSTAAPDRQRLHERDIWSARLLSMTAELDALIARLAKVRAVDDVAVREQMAELRLQLDALDEVDAT